MSSAKISISLAEFNILQNKIQTQEKEIQTLKAELEESRLGDGEGDRRRLAAALDRALVVTSFAIANLHPLTVRGWPYEALRELGELLAVDCPGVPETYRQCARGDWGLFSAEAERWERARAEGREQEMLAEENAARGIPLDHPLIKGIIS